MNSDKKIITISELNHIARTAIEGGFPGGVWVIGEVRQFKVHSSGNYYFVLRDESSQVDCTIWRNIARQLGWMPENGIKVEAFGQPSIYEKNGRYQFIVKKMLPAGKGDRALAFAMLKKKLQAEGLFDISHKKPLPTFPLTIGVVTSKTGAALRDIADVCHRRAPWVSIIVRDTLVQGDTAPPDIIRGIEDFERFGKVDLLIIGRGGGSEEDLWCFNDETLARKIYDTDIPIISAVGHEIDFTIADFVADVRAPTPSAAAEIAVPNRKELNDKLADIIKNARTILSNKILSHRSHLENIMHKLEFVSPIRKIQEYRREIDELQSDAMQSVELMLERAKSKLNLLKEKLNLLSIDKILMRGFSIVRKDEKIVRNSKNLNIDDILEIQFSTGSAETKVKKID